MKRRHFYLALSCALCALTLAPAATAFAGGKGKSDRIKFSPTGGGGGGGNATPMQLHTGPSYGPSTRNLSTSSLGSGASSSTFSKSLSTKSNKSFSQLNSNSMSLQKFNSFGAANKLSDSGNGLSSDPPASPSYHRGPKPKLTFGTTKLFSDAVKANGTPPLDPGIGNGTGGGTVKWPGKFTTTDSSKIADSLKKHHFVPIDGIRIGEPNGPGNGGGWDDKCPPKDKCHDKCHDRCDFPWWPIVVGGCYHGGWNNSDCYHGGCYDSYHGGRFYNSVVTYPVTNVTVIEPPATPAEPALAAGIDLELLDVRLVDAGDAARNLGPRYRLTFGNRGTDAAGNFQVMLMATADGTPQQGAPMATAELDGLASRQVLSADVRLPLSAGLATLEKFIVVVDSAAQVAEADENNNVALLDRAKIATIDATAVAVQ
jgi:CARDB